MLCFVIQPFDNDKFDNRFKDIFSPAIIEAQLEPYRVDQDPRSSIPIEDIEKGIKESKLCFADITLDNPNVWFELGYAIAYGKEVVLVCSEERNTNFPFDVQHRKIIKYATGSPSDYNKLKKDIIDRIKALINKSEKLTNLKDISKIAKFEGLDQHEVYALAAIAENLEHPDDHSSTYLIKRDMEAGGFTKVAATLALKSLIQKGFLNYKNYPDNAGEEYVGYSFTEKGWS
jgi:nucleoside 2-deoxyribosyltransferase